MLAGVCMLPVHMLCYQLSFNQVAPDSKGSWSVLCACMRIQEETKASTAIDTLITLHIRADYSAEFASILGCFVVGYASCSCCQLSGGLRHQSFSFYDNCAFVFILIFASTLFGFTPSAINRKQLAPVKLQFERNRCMECKAALDHSKARVGR